MRLVLLFGLTFFVPLNAHAQSSIASDVASLTSTSWPEVGVENTASLTQPMLVIKSYYAHSGYALTQDFGWSMFAGTMNVSRKDVLVKREGKKNPVAYCTTRIVMTETVINQSGAYEQPSSPVCFVDSTNSGSFDKFEYRPTFITFVKALPRPLAYTTIEQISDDSRNFKEIVSFNGLVDGQLVLSVAEYSGDMDKPAKVQALTIPLASLPMTVHISDFDFSILATDATSVKFVRTK